MQTAAATLFVTTWSNKPVRSQMLTHVLTLLLPTTSADVFGIVQFTNPFALYRRATAATECYALQHGYRYFHEDFAWLDQEPHSDHWRIFSKQKAALKYIAFVDYLLLLDGDAFPANWSRTLDEFVGYDVVLQERLHNQEIAAAAVLVRNSELGVRFLRRWLAFERISVLPNADNGALHALLVQYWTPSRAPLLEQFFREARRLNNIFEYLAWVRAVKAMPKFAPLDGTSIRILSAAGGFFRCLERTGAEYRGVMWNHWLGNEMFVHAKDVDEFLNQTAAMTCKRPMHGFIRPDLLARSVEDARRWLAEARHYMYNASFHGLLAKCFPDCQDVYNSDMLPKVPDWQVTSRRA